MTSPTVITPYQVLPTKPPAYMMAPAYKPYQPFGGAVEVLYAHDDEVITVGPAGTGKALAIDTPVLTTVGWKTMGTVEVGDQVFHPSGSPTVVTATSDIFADHKCYKVTLSDGAVIVADADHLWSVRTPEQRSRRVKVNGERILLDHDKDPIVVSTESMVNWISSVSSSHTFFSIDMGKAVEYPERKEGWLLPNDVNYHAGWLEEYLLIDPYVLGYWLGDGSSRSGDITTMDQEVIEYIQENTRYKVYLTSVREGSLGRNYRIDTLIRELHELGLITPRGSVKRIPKQYLTASIEQRLRLLKGLMDSDGCCCKRGGGCEFGNTNKNIVDGVCELIAGLGIKYTVHEGRAMLNGKDCGPGWRINFTTELSVFNVKRKGCNQRSQVRDTQKRRYITFIEEVPSVPTRCIKIAAEDGLFLAGRDLITTHNSRGCLEKVHLCSCKYPGMRSLIVRKTRESCTQSAQVTFEKFVIPDNGTIKWRTSEQEYRYDNGSVVVVGGLDKVSKVMSSDYDLIYLMEATEASEEDVETLTTRCRNGIMPYNQLLMDCNPNNPYHHLKKKIDSGKLRAIISRHEDNPTLYDHQLKQWTEKGANYLRKLGNLTGVRFLRFFKGIWAAAEGAIYPEWDENIHLINYFHPSKEWRRVWSFDFGYTNPFVWQCWAIDPEDHAYLFHELYHTKLLVEDAAGMIKKWQKLENEPDPEAIVCDWDAEGRATLERHLDLVTIPANKNVLEGIDSVKTRLKVGEDGKAGIYVMRDIGHETDVDLEESKKPYRTQDEWFGYEWEDNKKKEAPKKVDDHGMDDVRYLSTYLDNASGGWSEGMAS